MIKYLIIKREIEETQLLYQVEAGSEQDAKDAIEKSRVNVPDPTVVRYLDKRNEYICFAYIEVTDSSKEREVWTSRGWVKVSDLTKYDLRLSKEAKEQ